MKWLSHPFKFSNMNYAAICESDGMRGPSLASLITHMYLYVLNTKYTYGIAIMHMCWVCVSHECGKSVKIKDLQWFILFNLYTAASQVYLWFKNTGKLSVYFELNVHVQVTLHFSISF